MDSGFFKWVWRANALLILICALLIAGLLAWEMTRKLRREVFPTSTTNTLVLPAEESKVPNPPKQSLRFGVPSVSDLSGLYPLPLYAEQEYNNRGISKGSSGNLLNYLIIDMNSGSHRWLFPNADRLILNTRQIVHREAGGTKGLGHMLSIVERDTNSDGRLSARDTRTIYFTDELWSSPRKIRDGITGILSSEAVNASTFDLIVNTLDGTSALRISSSTAKIISEQSFSTQN